MSFKDLEHGNKTHPDTPEQAAARRAAEAEARAKAEAKASKHAGRGGRHDAPKRQEPPK